jgi:hypothetical protein
MIYYYYYYGVVLISYHDATATPGVSRVLRWALLLLDQRVQQASDSLLSYSMAGDTCSFDLFLT